MPGKPKCEIIIPVHKHFGSTICSIPYGGLHYFNVEEVGAHAHVRDASCFQEPILAFFSALGLSHWTIYYLSFFSMLTLSNFSVCPNFLLFI